MEQEKQAKTSTKKKAELSDVVRPGDYVDVYMYQSRKNKLALILDVKDGALEVQYDASAKKQTETIKLNSSRLAFARRYTIGYTGDANAKQARTTSDHFSEDTCRHHAAQLRHLAATHLHGLTALEVTQLIRCKHFIFLDTVLSLDDATAPEADAVLDYLHAYLHFIVFYLRLLPSLYSDLSRGLANPDLFLTEDKVAISLCLPEIGDALSMICGCQPRLLKPDTSFFYIHNELLQTHHKDKFIHAETGYSHDYQDWGYREEQSSLIETLKMTIKYFRYLFKQFESMGGVEALQGLMTSEFPLKGVEQVLLMQQQLLPIMEEQSEVGRRSLQFVTSRLRRLSNQEIKDSDIEQLKELVGDYQKLFAKGVRSAEELSGQQESVALSLIEQFIASPYLEKRVKAIMELKDMIEKVECDAVRTQQLGNLAAVRKLKVVDKNQLVSFIKEKQIVEALMLGSNTHQEIIKRTTDIVAFISKNDQLHADFIKQLWSEGVNKHESHLRAIYQFFILIIPHLKEDHVNCVRHCLLDLPLHQQNEHTVQILETIYERFEHEEAFENLWELFHDDTHAQLPQQLKDYAFQSIKNIVGGVPLSKKQIKLYFQKCVDMIHQHQSVYQAISIMHLILEKQLSNDLFTKKSLMVSQKHSVVDLFIEDIEVYLRTVGQASKSEMVVEGLYSFNENIFYRLQMLSYILQVEDICLSHEQVVKLWLACCVDSKGAMQKKELITIFYTQNNQLSKHVFANKEAQSRFFTEILCSDKMCDYLHFCPEEFDLFSYLFRVHNLHKMLIKMPFKIKTISLVGLDALWQIFSNASNQQVLENANNLLVTIYNSISTLIYNEIKLVHRSFMDRCLKFMQTYRKPRFIELIKQFLYAFQHGFNNTKRQNATKVTIIYDDKTMESKEMVDDYRKLAEQLNVAYKQMFFIINGQLIDEEPESDVHVYVDRTYHPKNYLSQEAEAFSILFSLLDESDLEFTNQVWELLDTIPTNTQLKTKILNLEVDWNDFIEEGFYRGLYAVQQIYSLAVNNINWFEKLRRSEGAEAIVMRLVRASVNFQANPLSKQNCLYLCFLVQKFERGEQEVVEKCVHIILNLSQSLDNSPAQFKVQAKLLSTAIKMLNRDFEQFFAILGREQASKVLQTLFIENDIDYLKQQLFQYFIEISDDVEHLFPFFYNDLLDHAIASNSPRASPYYHFLAMLILKTSSTLLDDTRKIASLISHLPRVPHLYQLLEAILQRLPHLKTLIGQDMRLVHTLMGQIVHTKQLQKSLNCLHHLLKHNAPNTHEFVAHARKFHLLSQWRQKGQAYWFIQSKHNEKSPTGYVGLYNLGCSNSFSYPSLVCYMNSLFQQLFMIKPFREQLLQKVPDFQHTPPPENLIYQLKCIFLALSHSDKQYYNPINFCAAFKDSEGNPINVLEQMDVEEFFNLLMDRLEAQLSSQKNFIQKCFGGVLSNEIIGKSCPHYSEREEPFFSISLAVKNKKTLEESLQMFSEGEMLQGDNAYFCDQCDRKVTALKRTCLKKLPNYLIMALKRFEFNFDLMAKLKVNDRCEFPFHLNLQAYSQQGLNKDHSHTHPDSYFIYELRGIIIHLGSADSGHYYAFIRDEDVWLEFNDQKVRTIEIDEIISEAYGGEQDPYIRNIGSQLLSKKGTLKDRSKNAYMLFYERVQKFDYEFNEVEPKEEELSWSRSFLEEIKEENQIFAIQKFVFSAEYFNFMSQLVQMVKTEQGDEKGKNAELVKVILTFALNCAIREQSKNWIHLAIEDLLGLLAEYPDVCSFVVEGVPENIWEYIIDNPNNFVRKHVVKLIATAAAHCPNPKAVEALVDYLVYLVGEVDRSKKYYSEFFDLFYHLAHTHKPLLVRKRVILALLAFFNSQMSNRSNSILDIDKPARQLNPHDYFGLKQQEDQSNVENFFEKKYERNTNIVTYNSRLYLWRALEYLLRDTKLHDDEEKLLYQNGSFYGQMMEDGLYKLSIRAIAGILCQVCHNSLDRSRVVVDQVLRLLRDKVYKEYRKYFVPIKKILLIPDSFQKQRIDHFMQDLLLLMQSQTKYEQETDISIQYLIRIINKNPEVFNWMLANPNKWKWIVDYLINIKSLSQASQQNNQNFQKCNHRLHGIYQPIHENLYEQLNLWKFQFFQSLTSGNKIDVPTSEGFDTDDDMTDLPIKVGQSLDYYFIPYNQWTQVQVQAIYGEMISISLPSKSANEQQNAIPIEKDNEQLAPAETLSRVNFVPGYVGLNQMQQQMEMQTELDNETEENNYNSAQSSDIDN